MSKEKFSDGIPLAEEIANIIRDRILKGEYGIGERIKGTKIAEELKVSRTPIREAFRKLEIEGLIETIPNRGSFALGFTKQDISDIYAVRAAVELLAVERAAGRISVEEIRQLQETFDLMEFYTRKRDAGRMLEFNRIFHQTIYKASGSRFLSQILNSYQNYVEETRKVTVYQDSNLWQILKEHGEILNAIKEHNKPLAQEKTRVHLINSQARAEEQILLKDEGRSKPE